MDIQLDQLRALSAAVTEGTFEAAARSLRITPSALSQRIKSLEESVGRILLQRVKPVHATESGLSVLRLARQFDLLAADTVRELGGDEPGGDPVRVPIAVNADSLETWVLPALAEVSSDVCFEIVREDQEHTTARLRDGTVMAAITSTAEPVQGCVVRGLGSMRYRPMASPGFAATWFGSGPTAAAYSAAPVVIFDRKDELQDQHLRRRTKRKDGPPRHYVPSSAGYADAVRLGLGWGMLPDLQTDTDMSAGRLVEIDPGAHMDVPLYWQQWKLDSSALSAVAAAIESAGVTALLRLLSRRRLQPLFGDPRMTANSSRSIAGIAMPSCQCAPHACEAVVVGHDAYARSVAACRSRLCSARWSPRFPGSAVGRVDPRPRAGGRTCLLRGPRRRFAPAAV